MIGATEKSQEALTSCANLACATYHDGSLGRPGILDMMMWNSGSSNAPTGWLEGKKADKEKELCAGEAVQETDEAFYKRLKEKNIFDRLMRNAGITDETRIFDLLQRPHKLDGNLSSVKSLIESSNCDYCKLIKSLVLVTRKEFVDALPGTPFRHSTCNGHWGKHKWCEGRPCTQPLPERCIKYSASIVLDLLDILLERLIESKDQVEEFLANSDFLGSFQLVAGMLVRSDVQSQPLEVPIPLSIIEEIEKRTHLSSLFFSVEVCNNFTHGYTLEDLLSVIIDLESKVPDKPLFTGIDLDRLDVNIVTEDNRTLGMKFLMSHGHPAVLGAFYAWLDRSEVTIESLLHEDSNKRNIFHYITMSRYSKLHGDEMLKKYLKAISDRSTEGRL